MIDESEERWWNLRRNVEKLQSEAEEGVQYKVLFLGMFASTMCPQK
jgi:hypothetical protein